MADYIVIIQPEAEADLDDAYNYLESRRVGLGFDLLEELAQLLSSIEDNPFLFQKIFKEKRRAIIQRFGYNIIYIINGDTIYILAIIHGSRNPKKWQRR